MTVRSPEGLPATPSYVTHLNGVAATTEDLSPLAFAGHAHFTAVQVRGGLVRGLDLHLDRLRGASLELFDRALPDDRVREVLRRAIAEGPEDLSLTATVFSPAGEFVVAGPEVEPEVLVRTGPASDGPNGPIALATVEHQRVLAHLKHVGEVAKTHYLRWAAGEGFDDAAFVDAAGRISEATIWNLAFWDGTSVVWPDADILAGTTMGVVRRQLSSLNVAQRTQAVTPADAASMAGAVVMNSWTPGIAVDRIGDAEIPVAGPFVDLLHHAFEAEDGVAP